MSFPSNVWSQIKNVTADELIGALKRDGWRQEAGRGAILMFVKGSGIGRRRTAIHYHPQKTYGPGILKSLLADIGWSVEDLRRLKLVR